MSPHKVGILNVIELICICACLTVVVAGCTAGPIPESTQSAGSTGSSNIVDQAAAEATAIIEQARATALVLQAQSEATALFAQSGKSGTVEITASLTQVSVNDGSAGQTITVQATPGFIASAMPELTTQVTPGPAVEVLKVTFGADGAYIAVYFTSTPEIAATFWQGALSVTDETSGAVYNEVPVMPVIGPLIARPRQQGQIGYFMLVNAPVPLQIGASVTVILGDFKKEHVIVQ